jgi:pyrroloquinoline quinone (PQQ) biosynthesis protein C
MTAANPSRGRFIEYLLDRKDVKNLWNSYTHHEFVQQLAKGNLPNEQFKSYLIQDYLYLVSTSNKVTRKPTHIDRLILQEQMLWQRIRAHRWTPYLRYVIAVARHAVQTRANNLQVGTDCAAY